MKKLVFVLSAVFGAAVAVNAQDTTSTQDPSTQFRTDTTSTDDLNDMNTDTTSLDNESQYRTDDQAADTTASAYQDQSASSSLDQPSPAGDDAASTSSSTMYQPSQDQDDDREEISVAELPAQVSAQLESADYSAWTVDKVYKKEKDGQTFYSVKLKQGNETKKIKFDAQGNKVEDKDKDKNHDQ